MHTHIRAYITMLRDDLRPAVNRQPGFRRGTRRAVPESKPPGTPQNKNTKTMKTYKNKVTPLTCDRNNMFEVDC